MLKWAVALFGMAGLSIAAPDTARAQSPCSALGGGERIGHARVLFAQQVARGSFAAPGGSGQPLNFQDLPAFCRIVSTAAPSPASNIVIEVWLPEGAAWNGKALGTGNGGFGGTIRYASLAGGLRRGYAVANTDMGTYPASLPGLGYAAGNGRPEAVRDWGFRATHEMALLTRAVAARHYGKAPARHYYAGCSTGGHQGLTEAQRYPDDYDGIIAGAAGHNRTHLHTMFAQVTLAGRSVTNKLTPAAFTLWKDAYLRSCVGRDGGAPSDRFLTDPTQCRFRPRELLCRPGANPAGCLSEDQVRALEAVYGGTRNPRTGGLIYPPEVLGAEDIIQSAFIGGEGRNAQVPTDLSRWVFGPRWAGASFDFDRDMDRVDKAIGRDVNALDPNLSRFAARGGKLIMFHGWADGVVSPIDSILYFDRIYARGRPREAFARLFMAPCVGHCSGGPGPDLFGQGAEMLIGGGSEDDLLIALDRWVETGLAPEQVLARRLEGADSFATPGKGTRVLASRPLCAYPKIAGYLGGDPARTASFACTEAPRARYEKPSERYLQ
jgi:feruloyl esterase